MLDQHPAAPDVDPQGLAVDPPAQVASQNLLKRLPDLGEGELEVVVAAHHGQREIASGGDLRERAEDVRVSVEDGLHSHRSPVRIEGRGRDRRGIAAAEELEEVPGEHEVCRRLGLDPGQKLRQLLRGVEEPAACRVR